MRRVQSYRQPNKSRFILQRVGLLVAADVLRSHDQLKAKHTFIPVTPNQKNNLINSEKSF